MKKISIFMFGLTALLCVSCLNMGGFGVPKQPTPEEITLIEAVFKDDAKAVNASLDKGLSPDTTGFSGETILMSAVQMNKPAMVDLLIKRGADINKRDHQNGLIAVAYAPNKTMLDKVIAAGGDIKATGKTGQTALWVAVASNNPTMIQNFIQRVVDVNATNRSGENALAVDSDGNTALFCAVAVCTSETAQTGVDPIDIVSLLLANKVNAKAVNKSGQSVIFVLGANTYEVARNIPVYNYLFRVAAETTGKVSTAVDGAIGGGFFGNFASKTINEEANKKFYEIAAKEITPKTYKALKAAGASF